MAEAPIGTASPLLLRLIEANHQAQSSMGAQGSSRSGMLDRYTLPLRKYHGNVSDLLLNSNDRTSLNTNTPP